MKRKMLVIGGVLLLIFLIAVCAAVVSIKLRGGAANIRVGPLTTRITKPFDDEGYIDYLTAINDQTSAGVTPENNSVVLMLAAMGPQQITPEVADEFYQRLGIDPLPRNADYLTPVGPWVKRILDSSARTEQETEWLKVTAAELSKIEDVNTLSPEATLQWIGQLNAEDLTAQLENRMSGPWTGREDPLAAGLLKSNEGPLRIVVAASRRPRYYVPLVVPPNQETLLINVVLPLVWNERHAVRLLRMRAMNRAGEGSSEAALEDLLTCLRIARLTGEGATLLHTLVGLAMESWVCESLESLAAASKKGTSEGGVAIDPRVRRRWVKRIRQLPPQVPAWTKIDRAERFSYLDTCIQIARSGIETLDPTLDAISAAPNALTRFSMTSSAIDWNIVMQHGNKTYDRIVQIGRLQDPVMQQQAIRSMDIGFDSSAHPLRTLRDAITMSGRSELAADMMLTLLAPAISRAFELENENRIKLEAALKKLEE